MPGSFCSLYGDYNGMDLSRWSRNGSNVSVSPDSGEAGLSRELRDTRVAGDDDSSGCEVRDRFRKIEVGPIGATCVNR